MHFRVTKSMKADHPRLHAVAWIARLSHENPETQLPPLDGHGLRSEVALRRATSMTTCFRSLGAKGRGPVEFQIRKAHEGKLAYSRTSPAVDYLLFLEVLTGFLVAFHDVELLGPDLSYGVGADALSPTFEHISGREMTVGPSDPVLLANARIVASLRHGPDRATRVQASTRMIWGVMFGSHEDTLAELAEVLATVCNDGTARNIWRVEERYDGLEMGH